MFRSVFKHLTLNLEVTGGMVSSVTEFNPTRISFVIRY